MVGVDRGRNDEQITTPYRLLKLVNWICVEDPFLRIRSSMYIYVVKLKHVLQVAIISKIHAYMYIDDIWNDIVCVQSFALATQPF